MPARRPSLAVRGRSDRSGFPILLLLASFALLGTSASTSARAAELEGLPGDASFDHDTTLFPLTGRHQWVECSRCHPNAQFEGTPTRCNTCHLGGAGMADTAPSATHIPVQAICSDCHTTDYWEPARMDHSTTSAECSSCHEGPMATRKPADHIATTQDCDACHGTLTWETTRFDHEGIVDGCFACHNGSQARGKPGDHIASSNDCELCHSTRRWSPAARFDHSGVVPGTCNGCHDGSMAPGQPRGHFSTSWSCDRCHTTNAWLPQRYDHAGTAYPGDHRVNLDCTDCHGGNNAVVTWSDPTYQPECAGCHARRYEPGEHRGRSVAQNADCGASGCHSVRSRGW